MTINPVAATATCPAWCTAEQGVFLGEEDHLHTGAPLPLTTAVTARLCVTIDPETGAADGPYVVVDSDEWTIEHTLNIGHAFLALAQLGQSLSASTGSHVL